MKVALSIDLRALKLVLQMVVQWVTKKAYLSVSGLAHG